MQNLCKSFGSVKVIDDFTATFSTGITALVGKNGVGKSTLARMVVGAERPSSGNIVFVSAEETSFPGRNALSSIGWLPQEFGYPPRLRVQDFLRYAAWLKGVETSRLPSCMKRVDEFFSLSTLFPKRMGDLSGGQLRRVGLAAAVAHEPTFLVLDEPTNALDIDHKDALIEYLESDSIKPPVVILITHMESDVTRLASQVMTLTFPDRTNPE